VPIYEYSCKCGNKFEKLVHKVDSKPQKCPKCGKPAEQVISAIGGFNWGKGGHWNK